LFSGHPNVRSLHRNSIEITKDEHLSIRGDCIIGVRANKGCIDLDERLKHRLRSLDSRINMEIMVGNEAFVINGKGDGSLTLLSQTEIVIRKSSFVCPRTMSIKCNKASNDIPRKMITLLQNHDAKAILRITAE
jgi:hypothetical protein